MLENYIIKLNNVKKEYRVKAYKQGILNNIKIQMCIRDRDYIDYAESICKGMKSGYFTFIAHPDLIFLNDFPWDDNCEKACDLIIETAKKQDLILEFNANGLRRGLRNFYDGKRYPYPHKRFWEKAASKKIDVYKRQAMQG